MQPVVALAGDRVRVGQRGEGFVQRAHVLVHDPEHRLVAGRRFTERGTEAGALALKQSLDRAETGHARRDLPAFAWPPAPRGALVAKRGNARSEVVLFARGRNRLRSPILKLGRAAARATRRGRSRPLGGLADDRGRNT